MDSYQPVIELRDWILQANSVEVLATRTIAGNSVGTASWTVPTGGLIVPQDEYWFVHEYSVFTEDLLAADTAVVAPAWKNGNATPAQFIRGHWAAAVTGPTRRAFNPSSSPFFVSPGSELLFHHEFTTATQIGVNGSLRYTPLPI